MICGSKWKSCECPWFNFENGEPDPLEHMQFPAHASTRSYHPSTAPRFSSGVTSPPSPRGYRSEHRPSVTETVRPRAPSYDEEDFDRRLQEQREAHAHVMHQKMPSFNGFDHYGIADDYERDMTRDHDPRGRAGHYMDDTPRRRAATVIAPSPPPSRHQAVPPPLSSFERPNSGPDYGAGGTWTRGRLHHSPERWHAPTPDRRRPSSPPRYSYPRPERHEEHTTPDRYHRPLESERHEGHPTPDRYQRPPEPERHEEHPTPDRYQRPPESERPRPRSPRRTSSFDRRLADRFNSGSRHTAAHSAPIGPPMMGMMAPPMMSGPISPIRAGHPPPLHTHPTNLHPSSHPMPHHHPGAHYPAIPMAPVPPPSGSGPLPPAMQMRGMGVGMGMGMEIEEFVQNNRSTRSLEQVGTPRREKDLVGGGVGGTGSPHAPSVKRRPAGQAHREHMKQEQLASVQAGLTGPGRGMDRVYEWRNYVEPGLPEGETAQSVVSGPSN